MKQIRNTRLDIGHLIVIVMVFVGIASFATYTTLQKNVSNASAPARAQIGPAGIDKTQSIPRATVVNKPAPTITKLSKPERVEGIGEKVAITSDGVDLFRHPSLPNQLVNGHTHTVKDEHTTGGTHPQGANAISAGNTEMPSNFAADPLCKPAGKDFRFRIVYAHPPEHNNYKTELPKIRDYVRRANGKLLQESYTSSNNQRAARMKVECEGRYGKGPIKVHNVTVTRGETADKVAQDVEAKLGLPNVANDKYAVKYLIFFDKPGTPYVAVGYGWLDNRPESTSKDPTKNNNANLTSSAVIYPAYWPTLNTLHEVMHTVGAVLPISSVATKRAHCVDGVDVMCYNDGTTALNGETYGFGFDERYCPVGRSNANGWKYGSAQGMPLDCHYDSYFRTTSGSAALDKYWNTGGKENRFFEFTPNWP